MANALPLDMTQAYDMGKIGFLEYAKVHMTGAIAYR
jgi:hypothetical protein